MKHKYTYFLLLFSIINVFANAQTEPDGMRLRDIVEEAFPDSSLIVGVTAGLWAIDTPYTRIVIDREFGYLTPEIEFKQSAIHPDNTTWDFEGADRWITHAREHEQIVRIHCPIGPQCSSWAEADDRTPQELEQNMNEFIQGVGERYNDSLVVQYMDVVNETLKSGEWFGPEAGINGWENPWTIIGADVDVNQTPLYIKKAFTLAKQYAPRIKKLYNHHEGPEETASWNIIKQTIDYLKDSNLVVDAVGWQAHVDKGWDTPENIQALADLVDWTHSRGMEFHITEASVFIKDEYNEESLQLQAQTYAAILEVLWERRGNGRVAWNTWHLTDAYTWRGDWHPSLFDSTLVAKPAYYAIQAVLEKGTLIRDSAPTIFAESSISFNPDNKCLNISLNSNQEYTCQLFDVLGRNIESFTINNVRETISLKHLKEGLYFVRLGGASKTIAIQ